MPFVSALSHKLLLFPCSEFSDVSWILRSPMPKNFKCIKRACAGRCYQGLPLHPLVSNIKCLCNSFKIKSLCKCRFNFRLNVNVEQGLNRTMAEIKQRPKLSDHHGMLSLAHLQQCIQQCITRFPFLIIQAMTKACLLCIVSLMLQIQNNIPEINFL